MKWVVCMTERDRIYLRILEFGLIGIRAAACAGKVEYCEIEAEHLHNLPSLIGEMNEKRHDHYFNIERVMYIERVDHTIEQIGFTLRRYDELWEELKSLRDKSV